MNKTNEKISLNSALHLIVYLLLQIGVNIYFQVNQIALQAIAKSRDFKIEYQIFAAKSDSSISPYFITVLH